MNAETATPILASSQPPRLFIGLFPAGIAYADRTQVLDRDYRRLAFLSYQTLELEWCADDIPADLAAFITADAQTIQARRGELFHVTVGQTVLLGGQ
jgi:hypothetical protein